MLFQNLFLTSLFLQVLLSRGSARGYLDGTGWMAALALLGFGLLSLLRITALYQVEVRAGVAILITFHH